MAFTFTALARYRKLRLLGLTATFCCSTLLSTVDAQFKQTRTPASAPAKAGEKEASAPVTPPSPMDKVPKVVAVVNGQTITRDRLAQECLRRFGPVVLDNLLNKYLILQACKAQGINITQADVNNEITRMANKFGLNTKLFLEAIEQERGISPEQYSTEIVWPMLALRALAADKIQVGPQEIEAVMQSEFGPKVQVRMIAVSQAEKAKGLHAAAVAAPETFRRLAKEQSEDAASASVEGLLPPIRRNSGDDQLERIAFQLQPNEISPIFQVGEMHVMLQCVRQLPATPPNAQMIPAIQQRITDQIRDQRLGEAANQIFAALQKSSQLTTVFGNKEFEAKHPGVAAFLNQEAIPMDQLAAECIARHGREILKGEINRVLLAAALKGNNKSVEQADIDAEVARAADSMGYLKPDGTPDVDAWLKSIIEEEGATIDLYVQDAVWPSVALKKLVQETVSLSPEDLQKGFAANFGPRAEVLAIVLSNQRTAEEVWQQARKSLTEQSFGELAAKYSVEPVSRSNYGKVPPIRHHTGQPTLEKAAFELQPGEISGVIALKDQYVVLYKQGETNPVVKDFEAVRPELEKELLEKKLRTAMQKQLDTLLTAAQIDNFLEQTTQAGAINPAALPATAARVEPAPAVKR
jgi:parvulin-like peptidyl-prolyl isomerase